MGGAGGGYTGLQGILSFLGQNPLTSDQFGRLDAGYTGANGAVGGAHGVFSGLSPWAVHYLATSGILQKNTPTLTDTTGMSGDDLFRANLQNAMAQMAPATYGLHSGVDASFLTNLLANGIGGHSAYRHGFDATGRGNGQSGGFVPPRNPGGGRPGGMRG
jgi:hypothetical protein